MPHIIVKCYPGRTDEQKQELAKEICDSVVRIMKTNADAVSIDIVDVKPEDWNDTVLNTEIIPNMDRLYKKPKC